MEQELTVIVQAADPSTSKSTPAPRAVTLQPRSGNVRYLRPARPPSRVLSLSASGEPRLMRYYRQLGREGQEAEDHRHRTYAPHEGCPEKVQECLPDRCTKRFERTNHQGRIKDGSGTLSDLGTAADCLGAQGIWVMLANAINGIQLQRPFFQTQVL
jgi:hypothetical protein